MTDVQTEPACVWDELSTEEIVAILKDVKTETSAVLSSGDITQQRWARTTGVIATALLDLYTTEPAGQVTQKKEDKTSDHSEAQKTDKDKAK